MKGRTPSAKEVRWMRAIRPIGCIVCIRLGRVRQYDTPEEYTAVHHIVGKTKKDAHLLTIPLCPNHHQNGEDARHRNKSLFVAKFGTELEMHSEVVRIVQEQVCG